MKKYWNVVFEIMLFVLPVDLMALYISIMCSYQTLFVLSLLSVPTFTIIAIISNFKRKKSFHSF